MPFLRSTLLTAGVLGGIANLSGPARAQDLPKRDEAATSEVNRWLQERLIPPGELTRIRPRFRAFAQYYADLVASPAIYKASLEPKFGPGPRPRTLDHDPSTGIFTELDRYILVPTPTGRVPAEKGDFNRELGFAFEAVLKPLIEKHPDRIVRINATRMLAEVCRSGGGRPLSADPGELPLWPTVIGLIKSPTVPTEIKNYALQAAANLLAAADVTELKTRKHSADNATVGELIVALTACIQQPEALMKGVTAKDATQEQLAVLSFVRRNAVRALAKVRFATFPGPGKKPLFPAYTLAQVCVSDPALVPAPSPAECIEAVLGLCNMAPTWDGKPVKGYNTETVIEAMVAGLRTFAAARADPSDRSLPWRHYGALLGDALEGWKPLFDPDFEADKPSRYNAALVPATVPDLIGRVQTTILVPVAKVDSKGVPDPNSRVDVEGLERFLDQLRNSPNRKPMMIANVPETTLPVGK